MGDRPLVQKKSDRLDPIRIRYSFNESTDICEPSCDGSEQESHEGDGEDSRQ